MVINGHTLFITLNLRMCETTMQIKILTGYHTIQVNFIHEKYVYVHDLVFERQSYKTLAEKAL